MQCVIKPIFKDHKMLYLKAIFITRFLSFSYIYKHWRIKIINFVDN